jgi:hypothetical protein
LINRAILSTRFLLVGSDAASSGQAAMKAALFGILNMATLAVAESSHAESAKEVDPPIPKGAVHLICDSDAKMKEIFTHFPYPPAPKWVQSMFLSSTGIYRVELNPAGTVSAITILRSMGHSADARVMKTFILWKARTGPLRVVDVTWYYDKGRGSYMHGGGATVLH